jgi:hypothetical protein
VAPPVPGSYSPIRDLLGRSLGRSTVPGPLQDPDGGEGTAAITLGEPIGIEDLSERRIVEVVEESVIVTPTPSADSGTNVVVGVEERSVRRGRDPNRNRFAPASAAGRGTVPGPARPNGADGPRTPPRDTRPRTTGTTSTLEYTNALDCVHAHLRLLVVEGLVERVERDGTVAVAGYRRGTTVGS